MKITTRVTEAQGQPVSLCDFSPPRSGAARALDTIGVTPDFISVNYNPGQSVRANSALAAAALRRRGHEVAFTLATRDMNRLALESLALGAQLLGLENIIVAGGDPFGARDEGRVKAVNNYRPTELIRAIGALNRGEDFRGVKLEAPTDFCVGAAIDLGRGLEREAALTRRKVEAGAQFFVTQPIFEAAQARRFLEIYASQAERPLPPLFWGLQVLERGGVAFGAPPERYHMELEQGRSGVAIALEIWQGFRAAGLSNVYLIPSIRRGGVRDYQAAQQVISAIKTTG